MDETIFFPSDGRKKPVAAFQSGREGSEECEETGGAGRDGAIGRVGGTGAWSEGLDPVDVMPVCGGWYRTLGRTTNSP